MISQPTPDGRRINQPTSVKIYNYCCCFLEQFILKRSIFTWYFLHMFNFAHKPEYLFFLFNGCFLSLLGNCAYMLIILLSEITLIISNWLIAAINYRSNHQLTKAWFWSTVELLNYSSTVLCNNCVYDILIIEWSPKEHIWNVSNQNRSIKDLIHSFNIFLTNVSKTILCFFIILTVIHQVIK